MKVKHDKYFIPVRSDTDILIDMDESKFESVAKNRVHCYKFDYEYNYRAINEGMESDRPFRASEQIFRYEYCGDEFI